MTTIPVIGDTLDLELYLSVSHLVTQAKYSAANVVDDLLEAMGKRRHVAMKVPHFLGGPFIVAKSDLLLTTPRAVAMAAAEYLPLRILPFPFELPDYGIIMTWHDRFTKDPGHRWLRELAARTTAAVASGEQ